MVWDFIQNQLLGMKWITVLIQKLLTACGLDVTTRIGGSLVFFLTVTPFCSCSSIPIFMGFTAAGLPLGVTFSFLISSPMVDLGSLVLLMSIFGWKVAVLYVLFGLVIAVAGGTLIEHLHMERQNIADKQE